MRTSSQADCRRRGTTLIEVMVAAMILATLAIAGGAVMHRARALHFQENHLRTATDIAASRLEELRAAPFAQLVRDRLAGEHYLVHSNGEWMVSLQDPGEVELQNGQVFPISTKVRFETPHAGTLVRAIVEVAYEPAGSVGMETKLSP